MKNLLALILLWVALAVECSGQIVSLKLNYFTTNQNPQANITNVNTVSSNAYITNLTVVNQISTNNTFNYITNLDLFSTNIYTTNLFATYQTNITDVTSNAYITNIFNSAAYITNLYGPFITNNNLYSTNIYTTNLFATYVTNNTDYITNLYGPFITNNTLYSTNIYVTNLTANYITNDTSYITNLYVSNIFNSTAYITNLYTSNAYITNLTANYITNDTSYITNLYVSNAFFTNLTVEFITNDFLFTTNLYTSNAFITNLTVQNITNNTLITTNAYISNAFITNITIFEAQWGTNKWVGPTNDIDFSFGTYQKFKASTDMEITGLKGVNPTNENTTVLLLDPGGANRTLYFPNNWTNYTLDKGNAYTIGSTNIAIVTLSQYGQENTNVLVRIWGVNPGTAGIAGVPNASGALTNNGTGTMGWYPSYAFQPAANAFTGSNYFSGAITGATNSNNTTPDMALTSGASLLSTNAAFTFLLPTHVDSTKTVQQWIEILITNTTASAVAISVTAPCTSVGTAYVTNLTDLWVMVYPFVCTNFYFIPVR